MDVIVAAAAAPALAAKRATTTVPIVFAAVGDAVGIGLSNLRGACVDPIGGLIYQHCKFDLAGQNFTTVDRATMACGSEVRAPFLGLGIVELANQIPVLPRSAARPS